MYGRTTPPLLINASHGVSDTFRPQTSHFYTYSPNRIEGSSQKFTSSLLHYSVAENISEMATRQMQQWPLGRCS